MIEAGSMAPDFTLPAADGSKISLRKFKGRYVALYFYPKDMTSGCTAEACDFQDRLDRITGTGAVVIGVSPDPVARHKTFAEKYGLEFILLSDEEHAVLEKYGVWKMKKLYGREYMGVERTTFLIGPDGKVLRVWPKVRVAGHADDVISAIESFKSGKG
jgi:peroxiredoxin Q/BCP